MSTPSKSPPDDPVLEITTSILTEAAQRPWLAALVMRRKPYWLTRLALLAQRVRNLPRHTRRALRRKLASGLAAAALLLALAGPPQTVYAASITVNSGATGFADDGQCSLAEAITNANGDSQLYNTPGECPAGSGDDIITLTLDVTLTSALPDINNNSNITLEGGGHTIQGNDTFTVLRVLTGSTLTLNQATISGAATPRPPQSGQAAHDRATMSGNNRIAAQPNGNFKHDLTISGSSAPAEHSGPFKRDRAGVNRPEDANSGGIFNSGTLTVTNSTITGHTAINGAGIFNSGAATVTDSTISYNTATSMGGGIANDGGLTTVQHSNLISNTAGYMGGGIANDGGSTTLTGNSAISGNTAQYGGGISNVYGGVTTVDNSTVSSNTADSGGGIANTDTLTVTNNSAIIGNTAYYDGGGVFNFGGNLLMTNNTTISTNVADYGDGGGIYNYAGTLTVENSTLSGNTANDGGGIHNRFGGTLTVERSTFNGNTAYREGGGIYNSNTLTVTNSTLSSNTATSGGGIANAYGDAAVINSTLSGNTASNSMEGAANGGGIYNYGGTLLVQNSTLSGNTALASTTFGTGRGGGISNYSGSLALTHSTIASNNAYGYGTSEGGGIHGAATISNSIVVSNTLGPVVENDCAMSLSSGGYNIESGESRGFDPNNAAGDQWDVLPDSLKLLTLANNGGPTWTHALDNGSMALEKIPEGTNGCGTTITTDQRGFARPGTRNSQTAKMCEIGAWEAQIADPTAITLRGLTATTNTSPGVLGVIGAALAALGALLIGRRRATNKQRING